LNHLPDDSVKPWAVFEEIPGKKFTSFPDVRDSINICTDKVCGAKKNIVDKPIILNIFSHTCPDLTLIDLPGITRIPLAGSD
jgi:dynamin 1-like protein